METAENKDPWIISKILRFITSEEYTAHINSHFIPTKIKTPKYDLFVDDLVHGITRGTGIVHRMFGDSDNADDSFPFGYKDADDSALFGYRPYNEWVYNVTKVATAALEVVAYYSLAKHGYGFLCAIPAITNFFSLSGQCRHE